MTGFLEPSLSYSSDGLEFMIPYFKVILVSLILLFARNISDRGLGFEGNFRKLHGKENNLSNLILYILKKIKNLIPCTQSCQKKDGHLVLKIHMVKRKILGRCKLSKTRQSCAKRYPRRYNLDRRSKSTKPYAEYLYKCSH